MTTQRIKYLSGILAILLLGIGLIASSQPASASSPPLHVQLISDQTHVGAGGTIKLHLIYYNSGSEVSPAIFKLNLSNAIDTSNVPDGAALSGSNDAFVWSAVNVQPGEAKVMDVNLKVKNDAQAGTDIPVSALAAAGTLTVQTPEVVVKVGPQKDQPFFVGFPDGNFHSASDLTRAETAAVIARVKQLKDDPQAKVSYSDVTKSNWAYLYIRKVTEAGYMSGYNGKFRPNDPITRAELVSLILRVRGIQPVPLASFQDTANHWAKEALGTAKALNYITGDSNQDFYPDRYIRRDDAAKLLCISFVRGPLEDGQTKVVQHFPDVSRQNPMFGWVEETAKVAHESVNMGGGEKLIRYLPDQTNPL